MNRFRSTFRAIHTAVLASAVIASAVLVAAPPAVAAGTITAFTLDSESGDTIGAGKTFTFVPPGATVTATGDASGVTMSAAQSSHSFSAVIAPPTGQSLTAGNTYTTAKTANATDAALYVSGDGRSCTTATGTLDVLEISVVGGAVDAFAATYEQHCDDAGPALFGELRYQSAEDFKADSVSPRSLDFATRRPSTSSAPQSVRITNTGSTTLTLGTAALSGADSTDFSIDTDNCSGVVLAVSGSCLIKIVFAPGSTGSKSASLDVPADTARGEIQVALSAKSVVKTTDVLLATSRSKVNFNGSVMVTAHLDDYRHTISKVLKIYATPYGGAKKLIKSGKVNSKGNLSVKISLPRRTSFVAKFLGDAIYKPDSSPTKTVLVYAKVKGVMLSYYAKSGAYRLYHYTKKCPGRHRGCPLYGVAVSPNHGGSYVYVTVQLFHGGSWHNAFTDRFRLASTSKQLIIFVYNSSAIIGVNSRAQVRFPGDADHLAKTSKWSYFRVTN